MVHILDRDSDIETLKEEFEGFNGYDMQVAYNNWGHLTLRFFKENEDEEIEDEFLVNFTKRESRKIIDFVKNHIEL